MDYYSKLIISEDFDKLIEELQHSNINFSKDESKSPISLNVSDYYVNPGNYYNLPYIPV